MAKSKTPKPKTFNLHWGSGIVEEEATIETQYHKPSIQLLKFTDGEAKGMYQIRFCFYDHRGRFQREPMILGDSDLGDLKKALVHTPKLKRLIGKLAG